MIDALLSRIDALNNPTVVGLDPTLEMIPSYLREEKFAQYGKTPEAVAEMFLAFNRAILAAVQGIVPAVKPQIAFYERYGLAGLSAYEKTAALATEMGFVVIGDIKRGDIGFHHFQIFILYLYLFRMTNYCRNLETTIQCFIQKGRAHKAACPDKDYLFHFLHILIYYNVTTI